MTNRPFPDWAPPDLVTYLETKESEVEADAQQGLLDEYDYFCTELDVCRRLLRKPAMEKVWWALHGKQKWRPAYDLKLVCEIALEIRYPSRTDRSNAARRDSLLEVAQKANELRDLLVDQEDITARDFAEIASRIDVRQLSAWLGHTRLLSGSLARRVASTVPRAIKQISGRSEEFLTTATYQDALEHLASIATERAHSPKQLAQRKTPNAEALSMALRLNDFLVAVLEEPLHERVATIVNAVWDSDLSRDNVKSAVRARDGRMQKAKEAGKRQKTKAGDERSSEG
jgi:hypothetical protein